MFSSVVALVFVVLFTTAAHGEGCFSIVVGKDASVDGYVIMAHNEDDGPPQIVHHRKVPRMKHSPGDKVELLNGGEVEQVQETWAYLWSEMPGMIFSDSYINEWGVCIASDACPSREDYPELTDGGISLMLRRLVAQRA
ncbi:C69 family dipeptidase, partial [bacterium]|nr:C69 family dipeptidase [bacterium]